MVSPQLIDPVDLQPNAVKMLVYGDVGQGKTTFASTAPNCLFISVEAGDIALASNPHAMDPRTRIYRVNSIEMLRETFVWIKTNQYGFGDFDTIVIDSLTDVQDKVLFMVMSREEAKDPRRKKGRPQQQDWQEVTNTLRRMVMNFRDLPKHVIFTALYRNDKSPNTPGGYATSRVVRAELSPAVYKAVSAYMDFVGFLQAYPVLGADGQPTGEMMRYLLFQDPSMVYATKVRIALPPYLENPTFNSFYAAMMEGINRGRLQ